MANHFLAIDPVALLDEDQLNHLSTIQTAGDAQDYIQEELSKTYEFSNVFQSTNSEHDLHAHEFMLANETGERKMHKKGVMKTPSDLLAFVTVDDEWIKDHQDIIDKGVHFKLHDRVDPKQLHAVNGLTADGQTTSAIRYAHYKSNVLMVSENEKAISKDETNESMEERATEHESVLRDRTFTFSLDPFRFVKSQHERVRKDTIEGAFMDGFMKGFDMSDNYKKFKSDPHNEPPLQTKKDKQETKKDTHEPNINIGDGLLDLSQKVALQQQHADYMSQK